MTQPTHTVATDALATLGTIIDSTAGRDAIHLAVEPVVAATVLYAGQHVGFLADGRVGQNATPHIGIVDPFVAGPIQAGQMFWLVVYPRTITSLRHVWEHPAFAPVSIPEPDAVPTLDAKAASEAWLRDFVSRSDCPDYHTLIGAAIRGGGNADWDGDGEYLHFNDIDAHGDIPAEFWDHVEIVTGQKIAKEDRAEYFSCSC